MLGKILQSFSVTHWLKEPAAFPKRCPFNCSLLCVFSLVLHYVWLHCDSMYPKEGQLTRFFHGFIVQQRPLWTFTLQTWGRPLPAVGVCVCEFYLASKFFSSPVSVFAYRVDVQGSWQPLTATLHNTIFLSNTAALRFRMMASKYTFISLSDHIGCVSIECLQQTCLYYYYCYFRHPSCFLTALWFSGFLHHLRMPPWGHVVMKESTVTLALAFFPPTQSILLLKMNFSARKILKKKKCHFVRIWI